MKKLSAFILFFSILFSLALLAQLIPHGMIKSITTVTGSVSTSTAAVNFSTEGTTDWIHVQGSSTDRKNGGGSLVSFSSVGGGERYGDDDRTFSWTGGTPTASGSDNGGIYVYDVGNGYSITVPAGNDQKTLTLFASIYSGTGLLTASLSDGSSGTVTQSVSASANSSKYGKYTVTYNSASANANLTVSLVETASVGGGGNVAINGAALESTGSSSSTGSLSGVWTNTTANVNLATLGTLDWIHWGPGDNTIRKASPTVEIENAINVGDIFSLSYSNDARLVSWTGGTPTASSTNNQNGRHIRGIGNGFLYKVPATLGKRNLKIYVGGYNSGATLTAKFSNRAPIKYTHTVAPTSGSYYRIYTLQFNAADSGAQLEVSWIMSGDTGSGNVTTIGATLF